MKNLEKVKAHFEKLIEFYQKTNEIHRAGSFRLALEKLEENFSSTDLPNDIPQLKQIRGIGSSTITEIQEVLTTGTSKRLIELEKIASDAPPSADEVKDVLKGLLNK